MFKNLTNKLIVKLSVNRLILHISFWVIFTVFFSFVYGPTYKSFTLKLFHTLFLLPVVIGASYFTMSILIDKYLLKYKYTYYLLTLLFSSIIFTSLQIGVYYYYIYPILYPESDPGQLIHFDRFLIEILRLYAIVTLATFFKLLRHWNRMKSVNLQLSEENLRAELKIKDIEKQKIEAELNALKSQLNPHFLFNVLNNIYSHSLLKSDLTPIIVLKLSDLMSYILYDCKTNLVPLKKEVEFIKNYIELEKIRLEDDIKLKFSINNINDTFIPPLLFVPLIENAFKHGVGSQPEKKCIALTIEVINNTIHFKLKNSKGVIKNGLKNNSKGGIGIVNVRKRLELLFPNAHKMTVSNNNDYFLIEVIIYKKLDRK